MDVVYIILIGVGITIMLLALLIRQREAKGNLPEIRAQRTTDKAELEQGMQRFAKQMKQEQAMASAKMQQANDALLQEVSLLRKRVEELESQSRQSPLVEDSSSSISEERVVEHKEPAEVDMLALRERYRRVFELDKEGLSPDEIAKRLGVGRGEIDLIFMLASKHEGRQLHA